MTPTPTVEVEFGLSLRELYAANLSILLGRIRYLLYIMGICVVICAVSLAPKYLPEPFADYVYAVASRLNLYALLDWLFPGLAGGGVTLLVMVPAAAFLRARSIKRKFGADKSRYVFSADGVNIQSALGNANLKWEMFQQIRENRRFFFFYSVPGMASLVPKRSFATPEQREEFRLLIRSQVKKFKLKDD